MESDVSQGEQLLHCVTQKAGRFVHAQMHCCGQTQLGWLKDKNATFKNDKQGVLQRYLYQTNMNWSPEN